MGTFFPKTGWSPVLFLDFVRTLEIDFLFLPTFPAIFHYFFRSFNFTPSCPKSEIVSTLLSLPLFKIDDSQVKQRVTRKRQSSLDTWKTCSNSIQRDEWRCFICSTNRRINFGRLTNCLTTPGSWPKGPITHFLCISRDFIGINDYSSISRRQKQSDHHPARGLPHTCKSTGVKTSSCAAFYFQSGPPQH